MPPSLLTKTISRARSGRFRLFIDKGSADSTGSNDASGIYHGVELVASAWGIPTCMALSGLNDTNAVGDWTRLYWRRRSTAVVGVSDAPVQATTNFKRITGRPSGWNGMLGIKMAGGRLSSSIASGDGTGATFTVDIPAEELALMPTGTQDVRVGQEYIGCSARSSNTFTIAAGGRGKYTGAAGGVAATNHAVGETVGQVFYSTTCALQFDRRFCGGMQGKVTGCVWHYPHKESEVPNGGITVPLANDCGFKAEWYAATDDGTASGGSLVASTRVLGRASAPSGTMQRFDLTVDSPTLSSSMSFYLSGSEPASGPLAIAGVGAVWPDIPWGIGFAFEDHLGGQSLQDYIKAQTETAGANLRLQDRIFMMFEMVENAAPAIGGSANGEVARLTIFGNNDTNRVNQTALVLEAYPWTHASTDTSPAGANAFVTDVPVADCSKLNSGGGVLLVPSTGEYIIYSGRSASSGPGNATACTRGAYGTLNQAINAGATIRHGYVTSTKLGYKTNLLFEDIRLRAAVVAAGKTPSRYRHIVVSPISVSDSPTVPAGNNASGSVGDRQYRLAEYRDAALELAEERNAELGYEAMGVLDLLSAVTAADVFELRDTPSDPIHHLAGGYVLAVGAAFRRDEPLVGGVNGGPVSGVVRTAVRVVTEQSSDHVSPATNHGNGSGRTIGKTNMNPSPGSLGDFVRRIR